MTPPATDEERFEALTLLEMRYAELRKTERASRAPAELVYHAIAQEVLIEKTRRDKQIAEARELLNAQIWERNKDWQAKRVKWLEATR